MKKRMDWAKAHFPQLAVIFLILLFVLISASSVLHKYLTVDESVYIAGGYSYFLTGDFRLTAEHPPLGKLLVALPLLLVSPRLPLESANWVSSEKVGDVGANYGFAADFFGANPESFFPIVFSARMVTLLLTVFLALLVFLWSRDLFGWKAGLLSLFIMVLEPSIIAHSQLATLDMPLTVFSFASFYFAYVFSKSGKIKFLAASALFFSFAVMVKFSALFFFPPLLLFLALQHRGLSKNREGIFRQKNTLLYYACIFAVFALMPLLFANILYSFDNYAKPHYFGVLPPRMFEGFQFSQNWQESGREGYLFGEFRRFIPEYFLAAFLMKTTIAFLVLLAAAFYFLVRKPRLDAFSLLVPAVGFFLITSLMVRFYLGLRYVLPAFPFLFVFCGILLDEKREKPLIGSKFASYALLLLLAFHAFSSLSIYPHYLAYFNEFIGPGNAPLYLTDSNLDWGQDLYYFMDFVRTNNIDKVDFIYFGWPYYGADFPEAYYGPSCEPITGKIAISATSLTGVDSGGFKCYEWLRKETPKAKIAWTIYYYELS
ncbi:MAG: glycosyltransferase family 39 protein [Candidatus Diapherotrites archaeon]|nr:glycosyltransferase family 39 protein [Candidatus Diapherotrites archaeon]